MSAGGDLERQYCSLDQQLLSLSQGLAIWRVLGEERAVNVFIALTVVALFGEPIDRDVVEVSR